MIMWGISKFAQSAGKFVENANKFVKNAGNFLDKKKLNKSKNDHMRC